MYGRRVRPRHVKYEASRRKTKDSRTRNIGIDYTTKLLGFVRNSGSIGSSQSSPSHPPRSTSLPIIHRDDQDALSRCTRLLPSIGFRYFTRSISSSRRSSSRLRWLARHQPHQPRNPQPLDANSNRSPPLSSFPLSLRSLRSRHSQSHSLRSRRARLHRSQRHHQRRQPNSPRRSSSHQ